MERVWLLLESLLASPVTWGVIALVALALALSGKLSMDAAVAVLWLAFGAAVFGIYRAEVILRMEPLIRILILGGCAFLLAAGTVAIARWMTGPKAMETQAQKLEDTKPTHTLLVRYALSTLPVRIAPHDTAYILQLNPNISQWVWEAFNPSDKAIFWRSDLHIKKNGPPGDGVYACEITNNEDKTFLDVSVPFDVSFHELDMVPASITKSKDGKQQSVTLPTPLGRIMLLLRLALPMA